MDKRAKYRQHIEDLKKLAQSQASLRQKVQQARRGQVTAKETTAMIFRPVTEAILGKQPETKSLSEEELKQLQEKGLVGIVKEQQEAAAAKIVTRSDEEKRKLAEALTANIADPAARQAETDRLINNPLELERRLAELTTQRITNIITNLSGEIKDIKEEQKRVGEATVRFMEVGEQRLFYIKKANDEIKDDEYNEFLEKENIRGIDNIDKWTDAEYQTLTNRLDEIIRDGVAAKDEISTAMEFDNMLPLHDRMRYSVIAFMFRRTAENSRAKPFGKGWNFKRKFTALDKIRVEKNREAKIGTGVKIFTSTTEMIGRLMLLISSKEAGNDSVEIDNEIVDILDHLRSSELLTSDEYETLHRDLIAAT